MSSDAGALGKPACDDMRRCFVYTLLTEKENLVICQRKENNKERAKMAVIMQGEELQHILRVLNTNIDGRVKVQFALTSIKGV